MIAYSHGRQIVQNVKTTQTHIYDLPNTIDTAPHMRERMESPLYSYSFTRKSDHRDNCESTETSVSGGSDERLAKDRGAAVAVNR